MAIRYGKTFRTRRGRYGRYKYVNGRKVAFVVNKNHRKGHKRSYKNKYYR
jgi:hypothetical protein